MTSRLTRTFTLQRYYHRHSKTEPDKPIETTPIKRRAIVDGTTFYISPRYKHFKLIARGSYGVVSSAYDNNLKQRVAVKKVHYAFENTTDAKHLLRELRLMRLLNHPNLLKLFDIDPPTSFKLWSDVYITSELMHHDLEDILNQRRSLSLRQIKYITWSIICALKYLHSSNIVHRDLKPGNILIDKKCNIKICDFGLARVIEQDEMELTKHVVTKSYRAPEVFLTPQAYDAAIDMWSVALILYEMLVPGMVLFPKKTFKRQLDCIFSVIGKPKDEDLEDLPDYAKWYITRLMKHHRGIPLKERFGDKLEQIDPLAVDLIDKLIQFNPRKRLTAEQALNHPYLAEFHNEKVEPVVPKELRAKVDLVEPTADGKHGLSKNELRRLVWNEMVHFHPEHSPR